MLFMEAYGLKVFKCSHNSLAIFQHQSLLHRCKILEWKRCFKTGYPIGTVRLENPISRVEVLKLIFMGTEKEVIDGINVNFPDTSNNNEWYSFLELLSKMVLWEGYPDGSFKPTQVNRSEFLKMLLVTASRSESMNVSVDPVVTENPL